METGHSAAALARGASDALVAAFGRDAGEPAASAEGIAWMRAVALAGLGRFAAARTLTATVGSGPFASAARCLEASMLRQSGRHRAASAYDGAALALAQSPEPGIDDPLAAALRVDATVGLAADALGAGRFALAATLLRRADEELAARRADGDAGGDSGALGGPWWTLPRAALRREWVATELAVYSGDEEGARRGAATLLAADPGESKPRHHAKTLLIGAAAAAASGDPRRAVDLARAGHSSATGHQLHPLQWAGARLMSGLSGEDRGGPFAREAAAVELEWVRDGAKLGRL